MPPKRYYSLLSPTIDIVFKMLLTRKNSGPLLLDLVNTIIKPKNPFVSLEVMNPEIPLEDTDHKEIALDILATTAAGDKVQIEMQARNHAYFRERAFYYATRLHSSQLTRGEAYGELRATYCIYFLKFNQFDCQGLDQFAHIFTMREENTGIKLTDHLEIHFIELLKFRKLLMKKAHGSGDEHLDNWLQFLLNPSDKSMERIIMKDPIIKDAMTHLNDISSDARARERARAREKSEHDWASMMADARRAGLAEGEAKGKAEGEAKGKVEVLKSLLKNPVTAGLLDAELAALVSLPLELIAEVRASLRS